MININVIGRLAADAESKTSQKGTQYVQFRMGVDDYANGKSETVWFNVTSSTEQALRIAQYLTKGKLICIHGTESLRLFTNKQNETVIGRDIIAYSIDFVSAGRKDGTTSTTTTANDTTTTSLPQVEIPAVPAMATTAATDDDLPF